MMSPEERKSLSQDGRFQIRYERLMSCVFEIIVARRRRLRELVLRDTQKLNNYDLQKTLLETEGMTLSPRFIDEHNRLRRLSQARFDYLMTLSDVITKRKRAHHFGCTH